MGDRPRYSSLRKGGAGRDRGNISRRLLSVGLATFLFILAAVVHLTHTCTPHRALLPWPPGASLGGERHAGMQQDPVEGLCLACLFLHALNATQIAFLNLDLSWLSNHQKIFPCLLNFRARDAACLCLIRAPPSSPSPG